MKSTLASLLCLAMLPLAALGEEETLAVSGMTFKYGEPWIRQQATSSMRAGQFIYDHKDEALKDIELVIFHFGPGQGGSVEANISRWVGQFEGTPESKTEEKEMGEKTVTFLTATGTYMESSGGPFSGNKTARPGYTMLAAILPSEGGDVYLKLAGPTESVEAMKDAFMAFAKSPFEE